MWHSTKSYFWYRKGHQFFGTWEHHRKSHRSLLSGWMNWPYTACCWVPSSNILILPSQFWQIRFESYWLHCSKCRILVFLWYHTIICMHGQDFVSTRKCKKNKLEWPLIKPVQILKSSLDEYYMYVGFKYSVIQNFILVLFRCNTHAYSTVPQWVERCTV